MSDPIASSDPTKKALFTPAAPPEPPKSKPKPGSLDLEYVPPGAGALSPKTTAPPLTSVDPALWPPEILERNYFALRGRMLTSPSSVTTEERALFAKMEKLLQPAAPSGPKTATQSLADSGVTLGKGIEKAHMTTAEVEKYVAEYTAYVASRKNEPKYAALHADALASGPAAIDAHRAADHARDVQALTFRVGELVKEGKVNALKVPMPIGLQASTGVAAVSIPVASVVDSALAFVPVAGQLWIALEVATGKTMGGIGADIPTTERVISAAMLVLPHAKKLLASGGKGAEVVVELARRTGKSPEQVIALASQAVALEKEAPVLNDALTSIMLRQPLSKAHHAALDRAEKVLGFSINRKYTPTVTGTTSFEAGKGGTDKHGNVWYSTLGSKTDQALALNHELWHSKLSPKTLNALREIRADVRMSAYMKSSTLRYAEEASAELYARVKVEGLNPQSVITGVRFPMREGYVKFLPGMVSIDGKTQTFAIGIVPELVLGTVTYGGVVYTAVMVEEKAIDAYENAKNKGAKP